MFIPVAMSIVILYTYNRCYTLRVTPPFRITVYLHVVAPLTSFISASLEEYLKLEILQPGILLVLLRHLHVDTLNTLYLVQGDYSKGLAEETGIGETFGKVEEMGFCNLTPS